MNELFAKNNRIYFESVTNYPHDHRGVKWSSAQSQSLRFKILCGIANDIFNSKILDVGCGMGHLVDYLIENQFSGEYKGIDIVDQMILRAKKRHPCYQFETNDIDSIQNHSYDYVLASGLFAFLEFRFVKKILRSLFSCAIKGVAFNCLSSIAPYKEEGMIYQSSTKIYDYCSSLSQKVILKENYLPNDFSIYMYR